LQKRTVDGGADLAIGQLAPIVQVAGEAIAAGDMRAIAPYLGAAAVDAISTNGSRDRRDRTDCCRWFEQLRLDRFRGGPGGGARCP
jgi:hypothetical protein